MGGRGGGGQEVNTIIFWRGFSERKISVVNTSCMNKVTDCWPVLRMKFEIIFSPFLHLFYSQCQVLAWRSSHKVIAQCYSFGNGLYLLFLQWPF